MNGINYSQCWEDTSLLKEALDISKKDIVLSITSGGDNTIAILLENPKKVFSVDMNPAQNYLLELKLRSAKALKYEEYLELLGVKNSRKRLEYYAYTAKLLSDDAAIWFESNPNLIKAGIIHSGKFERYLNRFRKYLLPLVHSKRVIAELVNQGNLNDQITYYEKVWNTRRWRFFFSIASNPYLLMKHARQTGARSKKLNVSVSYLRMLEILIYRNYLKTNFYLNYALTGEYGELLPDYLLEENYCKLQQQNNTMCEFCSEDILKFFKSTPSNYFTKYNLSDAFEFLDIDNAFEVWGEVIRTAKNGARVVYWCNQVDYLVPIEMLPYVSQSIALENKLKAQDRLYFYRGFHIYTITK